MFAVDYSPRQWGAIKDYDKVDWNPWRPDKWVVHWGGGANVAGYTPYNVDSEMGVLRAWERYHLYGKGWLGIAYNYAIGQTGTVYRLRGENRAGATSGDYENDGIPENSEARAVVFIMGKGQEPSGAALRSFSKLWEQDQKPVIWHDAVRGPGFTECPGPDLIAWVKAEGYKSPPDISNPEGETIVSQLPVLGPASKKHGYNTGVTELNEPVQRLQGLLVAANVAPSDPYSLSSKGFDGKFGPGTEDAVRTFQRKVGIKVDGIVGEQSWAYLLGVN